MAEADPVLEHAVAIVGMAGRFPGAEDLDAFWRNLREGSEAIVRVDGASTGGSGAPPARSGQAGWVPAAAAVERIELFDATFFGVNPRDAEVMDPQQRLFLECCWETLESAGCDPARFGGRIGLYAGARISDYFLYHVAANPSVMRSVGGFQALLLNDKDYLATNVSYRLDLRGPSINVQTACSTSLVALHLATESLLARQCDLVLAGGVSLRLPQKRGYQYIPGGVTSPDGHCRAFDARAGGTVFGNGLGVVALQRLEDALAQRRPIRALVRASAVNNDGSARVSFSAPGVEGQAAVLAEALELAGVEADSVGHVEAHGTGTQLGDAIEVEALRQTFDGRTERTGFCALSSVKTNIGHLEAAAGVAGVIKTVLMMENGELVPNLHFERPNPELGLEDSPFFVSAARRPWPSDGGPRRAGVSSFGIGGTNAHAILEEAPEVTSSPSDRPAQLLLLSARSRSSLEGAKRRLADHLDDRTEVDLADVGYTLATGRRAFEYRLAFVCTSRSEAVAGLRRDASARLLTGRAAGSARPVAFLFPGQGSQHAGMAAGLYRSEPVVREVVDRCADHLRSELGLDLRDLLFASGPERGEAGDRLQETRLAQPALFVVEHALAELLGSWGIEPAAVLGHSVGALVAACRAGVFCWRDALSLLVLRGRLIQERPRGAMTTVALAADDLEPLLGACGATLAAANAEGAAVASGPEEAIKELEARLAERSVEHRRLRTSHAFHSEMLRPAVEPFRRAVAAVDRKAPRIPFLSDTEGTWITDSQATDPFYWAEHLVRPVRFSATLECYLRDEQDAVLLEVGPGQALSQLARRSRRAGGRVIVPLSPPAKRSDEDVETAYEAVGRLWLSGVPVAWGGFYGHEDRRLVPLPTYAFDRRRYWIEPSQPGAARAGDSGSDPAPEREGPAPEAETEAEAPPGRHERPELPTPHVPPRSDLEQRIVAIWGDILGFEGIGVEDRFLDLGGHSLLVARVVTRLRESLEIELSAERVFDAATPAELALDVTVARAERVPREVLAGMVGELDEGGAGDAPREEEGRSLLERIATLSPEGLAALFERLAEHDRGAPERIPLRPKGIERLPLSFSQQRLWYQSLLDRDDATYNMPVLFRAEGPLDRDLVHRSLQEIVRRHEILRTRFEAEDGEPYQAVLDHLTLPTPLVDLTALPAGQRQATARGVVGEVARRPFDLDRVPLAQVVLFQVAEQRHLVLLNLHHLLADEESLRIMTSELGVLYAAYREGHPPSLPDLPVQYGDFSLWQRERLARDGLEGQIGYWRRRLQGVPRPSRFASETPASLPDDRSSGQQRLRVDGAVGETLHRLGRDAGCTPFMTWLAIFSLALVRHGGGEDVVVGTPISHRDRLELEGLIGLFHNTVVLRIDLPRELSFVELLPRVRERVLEAQKHQDVPYEQLVDLLQPTTPARERSPLFEALFVYRTRMTDAGEAPAGDLRIGLEAVATRVARFPLKLELWENQDRGVGSVLEFQRGLVGTARAERFARAVEDLSGFLSERPAAGVGELLELADEREAERASSTREEESARSRERLRELLGADRS